MTRAKDYGLRLKYRPFRCEVCGRVQLIQTNHRGECISYCYTGPAVKESDKIAGGGCSWAPSFGPSVFSSGYAYRKFKYAAGWKRDKTTREWTAKGRTK